MHTSGHFHRKLEVPRLTCPGRQSNPGLRDGGRALYGINVLRNALDSQRLCDKRFAIVARDQIRLQQRRLGFFHYILSCTGLNFPSDLAAASYTTTKLTFQLCWMHNAHCKAPCISREGVQIVNKTKKSSSSPLFTVKDF